MYVMKWTKIVTLRTTNQWFPIEWTKKKMRIVKEGIDIIIKM